MRAEARWAVSSTSSTSRRSGLSGEELEQEELAPPRDHGEQVVEVVRDAAGEAPDRLHLLGVAELRLERPDGGEVADDDDDPEILPLAALERGRGDLDGDRPPIRPGSVTVPVRPVRHWIAACRMATISGAWARTSVTGRPRAAARPRTRAGSRRRRSG